MFGRDGPLRRQRPGILVDPEARDRRLGAMPEIEHPPVRADGHYRRPARGRYLGLARQLAAIGIDGEDRDLILVLQAHVERRRHLLPSLGLLS